MGKKTDSSTDDYKLNKYKSHGRVEFERDGQILICNATGPFNRELVEAIASVQPKLIEAIISDGDWADITVLSGSVLATPDALVALGEYLKSITEQGIISCASGLVVMENAEGSRFTLPHIMKAFADTGTDLVLFDELDAAKEWALGKINVTIQREWL